MNEQCLYIRGFIPYISRKMSIRPFQTTEELDATDLRILAELQSDGRLPLAELGRRVALSPPSVGERVRRLEDRGVISGYSARVDPQRVGRRLLAFIRLSPSGGSGILSARLSKTIADLPEVLECYHVSGEDCYIIKVAVPDIADIRGLVEQLSWLGRTTTSLVLTTLAEGRPIVPPDVRESGSARPRRRSSSR